MIAAGDAARAAAGQQILQAGGNAEGAAPAAAIASFIAEIGVVHLGGSGIAHLYDPQTGQSVVDDFFSSTPGLNGRPPTPLDFHQVTIDFGATTQDFYLGRASVAVPGNIAGLCQLAADYGRLPLHQVLEPALKLAQDGHTIAPFQADTCTLLQPLFKRARQLDFALGDIAEILAFRDQNEPPCQYVMNVMAQQISAIEERVADLQRLRDELATLHRAGLTMPEDIEMKQCVCHLIKTGLSNEVGNDE